MPRINHIVGRGLPVPTLDPGVTTAPYAALARAGGDIQTEASRLSDFYSTMEENEKKAERRIKAVEIISNVRRTHADAASNLSSIPADLHDAHIDKIKTDIQDYVSKTAGGDQELLTDIELRLTDSIIGFEKLGRVSKQQKLTDGAEEAAIIQRDNLLDGIGLADEEEQQDRMDEYREDLDVFVASGHMKKNRRGALLKEFDDTTMITTIETLLQVNNGDTKAAEDYINSHKNELGENYGKVLKSLRTRANSIESEIRIEQERVDKEAEKRRVRIVRKNDLDSLNAFYNGKITTEDLSRLATNQLISKGTFTTINDKLLNGDNVKANNPVVVGDIATAIKLKDFDGAEAMLTDALKNEQITTPSYINYTTAIADDRYDEGQAYIDKAIKPSKDEWDPERQQKYADALDLYNAMVAGGEDPVASAKEIISLSKEEATSFHRFRKPRFMVGSIEDFDALQEAERETIARYKLGEISERVFLLEMEHIDNIEETHERRLIINQTDEEIVEASKTLKVGK